MAYSVVNQDRDVWPLWPQIRILKPSLSDGLITWFYSKCQFLSFFLLCLHWRCNLYCNPSTLHITLRFICPGEISGVYGDAYSSASQSPEIHFLRQINFCLNSSPLVTTFTSHQTMQAPPRSKHCIMGYHQRIIYWPYVRVCCSFPNWSNLIFPGIHSLTLLPPSTPPPLDISPHTQDKVEKHQKHNMILIKMQFTKRRGERSWWLRITTATFFSNSTRGSMMIKKMMMMIVTIILMTVASWQDYSGLSDLGVLKTACQRVLAPRRREKGGENCTLQKRQSSSGGDRWLKKDKHHDLIMSQF